MALLTTDLNLLDSIASRMKLRSPNKEALATLIGTMEFDDPGARELTARMATGTGKTYVMRALIEYAAAQGIKHIMVVVPGRVVRAKTVGNLTSGADGFIEGGEEDYTLITPENFQTQEAAQALNDPERCCVVLMNIDLLSAKDSDTAQSGVAATARRTNRPNEFLGGPLYDHLKGASDLLLITDECHLFQSPAYSQTLESLRAVSRVGLTATPHQQARVVFEYPLKRAVDEQYVKAPIIATRSEGYKEGDERAQLSDGLGVLTRKSEHYRTYERVHRNAPQVNPVMFVACADIEHANRTSELLRSTSFFGSSEAVLQVDSKTMTADDEAALYAVEAGDSPVRAVVNVNMLNAGWDVHNVAVLVPLRALKSKTLTEQMIGRGLRLPYGKYTGSPVVDSLDIIGHPSMGDALRRAGFHAKPSDEASAGADWSTTQHGHDVQGASERPSAIATSLTGVDLSTALTGGDTGDDLVDVTQSLGGGVRDLGFGGQAIRTVEDLPVPSIVRLKDVTFPCPTLTRIRSEVKPDLDDIQQSVLKEAASRVGSDYKAAITRRYVFKETRADTLNVASERVDLQSVRQTLVSAVANASGVLMTNANVGRAVGLVNRFLNESEAGDWTGLQLASARMELSTVVTEFRKSCESKAAYEQRLGHVDLPAYEGSLVEALLAEELTHEGNFVTRAPYAGWGRGLFNAARFDAYSTEMVIARYIDAAEGVDWWTRIYATDHVHVDHAEGTYIPDFVVCEGNDFWIVEGKGNDKKLDRIVKAKADATGTMLNKMKSDRDERWAGQHWHYLLAFESDVKFAKSWENLKKKGMRVE